VKGTLTIAFAGTGFSLCAGTNSFQFTANGGSLTGSVTGMAVNCNGGDPGPTNVCALTLWLTAANGSARFGGVTGQMRVDVEFRVVSGDFYSGTFGTGGTGTIDGTLAL
jgi:hypothetical protein